MEVMRNAVVKTRTLKPLPGEITSQRINDATLPVKIEAARRAIAECTDLPELLRYKSQAEGLAAAVRTMKEVGPELIKRANEMMADAWRKGGELLSAYSSITKPVPLARRKDGTISTGGREKSPRAIIAQELGLTRPEAVAMVRLSAAPAPKVYIAANKTRNIHTAAAQMPALRQSRGSTAYSDALRMIMSGAKSGLGLTNAFSYIKRIPLDQFAYLTPNERKVVKAKITEIVELLDEMDRLCR